MGIPHLHLPRALEQGRLGCARFWSLCPEYEDRTIDDVVRDTPQIAGIPILYPHSMPVLRVLERTMIGYERPSPRLQLCERQTVTRGHAESQLVRILS